MRTKLEQDLLELVRVWRVRVAGRTLPESTPEWACAKELEELVLREQDAKLHQGGLHR
jgi:hypothetical protein